MKDSPHKIVYVIGSLGRGGAEQQTLLLMSAMMERGVDVRLFVLQGRGDLHDELEEMGIESIDGGYDPGASRPGKVFALLRATWRLWRYLRRERPVVIHGVLPLTNLLAAVLGRLAGTPRVITSRRALNTHQERVPGWRYADMISTWLSHRVVANSEAVKRDTLAREGGKGEKIHVIHNRIDIVRFRVAPGTRERLRESLGLPAQAKAKALLIVANLIPYKGHEDLLRALARLGDYPALRLLVAGEDRGIDACLKVEVVALGVAERVGWLGLRRDIPELLAAADIYVSASHEEGFSNALLEAMAAGKPVVATCVGGNPEMLEDGRAGGCRGFGWRYRVSSAAPG